jgi:hypothetical protein
MCRFDGVIPFFAGHGLSSRPSRGNIRSICTEVCTMAPMQGRVNINLTLSRAPFKSVSSPQGNSSRTERPQQGPNASSNPDILISAASQRSISFLDAVVLPSARADSSFIVHIGRSEVQRRDTEIASLEAQVPPLSPMPRPGRCTPGLAADASTAAAAAAAAARIDPSSVPLQTLFRGRTHAPASNN